MTQEQKLKHIRSTLKELEDFCISNKVDCKLMFTGGVSWRGSICYAQPVSESDTPLLELMASRQWSGVIFEITFKDSDNGDEINCMKELVGYLNDELKRDD